MYVDVDVVFFAHLHRTESIAYSSNNYLILFRYLLIRVFLNLFIHLRPDLPGDLLIGGFGGFQNGLSPCLHVECSRVTFCWTVRKMPHAHEVCKHWGFCTLQPSGAGSCCTWYLTNLGRLSILRFVVIKSSSRQHGVIWVVDKHNPLNDNFTRGENDKPQIYGYHVCRQTRIRSGGNLGGRASMCW